MAAGASEVAKGIVTAWTLSTTLRSGAPEPDDVLPYVVFQEAATIENSRSSEGTGDSGNTKRIDLDVPIVFRCYAGQSATKNAKVIAEALAEDIKKIFGGHPQQAPASPILDMPNASHLQTRFLTETNARIDEGLHMWQLTYVFKVDMPVRV